MFKWWTDYAIALTSKWGYFEINPPIEIYSISDNNDIILVQIKEMTKTENGFADMKYLSKKERKTNAN